MKIVLTLNDDQTIDVSYTGNATYPAITAALQTAQLAAMEQVMKTAKSQEDMTPERLTDIKGQVFDIYNGQASLVLDKFAPDIELRKDLTADSMLKAENEVLDGYKKV